MTERIPAEPDEITSWQAHVINIGDWNGFVPDEDEDEIEECSTCGKACHCDEDYDHWREQNLD